ncbi:MAG: helix-turn-helix domain-containing protein [Candidatus Obscuribacter sp.]|jgi:excisionase family DNA binding protein|nr:helix-turn-helix domain-containing protein [Candidatus Obscuribacter sp.]
MQSGSERRSVVPSPAEVLQAQAAAQQIAALNAKATTETHYALTDRQGTEIDLSESACRVLLDALSAMADGHSIMLVPLDTELTTQQAAEMLNVSRPFLVALLESGEIAYRRVGRYRRIRQQDLLDYQSRRAHQRKETMNELTEQAQKLKLGY